VNHLITVHCILVIVRIKICIWSVTHPGHEMTSHSTGLY